MSATRPKMEFSIGITARSALHSRTAMMTSSKLVQGIAYRSGSACPQAS